MKLNIKIKFCKEYFNFEIDDIDADYYNSLTKEEQNKYLHYLAMDSLMDNIELLYDLVD